MRSKGTSPQDEGGSRALKVKWLWPLFILAIWVTAACEQQGELSSTSGQADQGSLRTEVERGPVKLTVELIPGKPRLSDEPTLTITVNAADGVKVTKPPFGKFLGGFLIRDFQEPLPEIRGGRQIIRQVYRLEPTTVGKQFISPIPMTFEDLRPEGDGQMHTIETEALSVEVTSMVDAEVPSLANLKPPAGPMELANTSTTIWWIWALAGMLGLAAVAWLVARRRRVAESPQFSPAELAYLELQKLLEDDPISHGDFKTYYVELTAIVRRYIERTTGIRAPEQTTAEFLQEVQRHNAFDQEERVRLKAFLESADLVKFAAFEPAKEDIEVSFERAKEFMQLTQAVQHSLEAAV